MITGTPRSWLLVAILACAGCGSTNKADDPLSDVRNDRLGRSQRIKAIHEAWAQAQAGTADRLTVREELKNVAWSGNWPIELRRAALEDLASDTTEKGEADTRQLFSLMVPREPDRGIVAFIADRAAASKWKDMTPALVRSLSRVWPDVPDQSRPEYRAITALNAGTSVQEVVYDVFLHPPAEGGAFGLLPAERVRADAWDLLARVDADGQVRARLLSLEGADSEGAVADMRAAQKELRCLPLSGDELRWLSALHNARDAVAKAWWDQTAAAVAAVETAKAPKLQLRHLEPIRWATSNHSEWIQASREQLLEEIARRINGRDTHRRRLRENQNWRPSPERLSDWRDKMSWADALAILVTDDAVRHPAVVKALFAQAEMDYEDRSAEYGGIIRFTEQGPAPILYPPRPGTRRGDREFVASTDMILQSDQALVHYHFHVQEPRNAEYAGPSANDLAYSARYGRTCLVFTSVSSEAMDVDLYSPDGVVIDLGEIRKP